MGSPSKMTDEQIMAAHDEYLSGACLADMERKLGVRVGYLTDRFRDFGLSHRDKRAYRVRSQLSDRDRYGPYIEYLKTH